ncbi:MAG: DUF255 domain-containing protein, partial [Thiovulaceae bacterium]|nr:DUF255 domain-containing protein [Sulfurimonadaceae bacterium]
MITAGILGAASFEHLGLSKNFYQARSKAVKEGKLIMLIVVNHKCKWCTKLSEGPLRDKKVKSLINDDFVPVVVNQATDKGLFPIEYQTTRVPSIFYIDPYSHELWTSIGYRTT